MTRQRHGATETRTGAKRPSLDEAGGDAAVRTSGGNAAVKTSDGNAAVETSGDVSPWGRGSKPAAGLYLVATPIGNLRDITLRALDVLAAADLVACEDTRVTGKLLRLLGLKASLTPYHDHNADQARPALLARMEQGGVVALVSDAGTPLVSDPGYRLVRDCVDRGIAVTALPGASAVLTGLQLSALPVERFLFAGFLPPRGAKRRAALQELAASPATLVLYEAPHRAAETLADMAAVLGDREAALARELTKMHEEVVRGPLSELAARFAATPPRGEVVIVAAPPGTAEAPSTQDVESRLRQQIEDGASLKDAAALIAAETGHPRREVYALALRLFRGSNEE